MVLRSNFALLLTIQFALLISSLINIISLLLTTFDWTKVRGIAPRSHTGRPRTCLVTIVIIVITITVIIIIIVFTIIIIVIIIISDPRRGCYMGLSTFIFFFFFFFFFPPRFCPAHIFGTVTRRDSKLSLLLGPAVYLCTLAYHPIHFVVFFYLFIYFLFFSAKILSGPYLWNRYSQRLQIECAAWSCGLVVHCCLPSNSLCYYFFFFFCHDFVRAISLEPLLAETPN